MLKGLYLSQRQALSLSLPNDKKIRELQEINNLLASKVLNCLVNVFSNVTNVSSDLLQHFKEKSHFAAYWQFQKSNKNATEILNQIKNVLNFLQRYLENNTLSPKQQTVITSFIESLTMYQTVVSSFNRVAQPVVFRPLTSKKENGRFEMDFGKPLDHLPYKHGIKKF